jgi:hypothetical protein
LHLPSLAPNPTHLQSCTHNHRWRTPGCCNCKWGSYARLHLCS